MTIDLTYLNDSQRTAVTWSKGPLMVVAGPGSGKTKVLTHRIARLIEETPKERFRVLGITFTNKAASEMRTRIDGLLNVGRERALLTTFHAFAADLLRQHGSHIGLRPDFSILSEPGDDEDLLEEAIDSALDPADSTESRAPQFMPIVTRMLQECVPPQDAVRWLGHYANSDEAAAVYGRYRTLSLSTARLGFSSLLTEAVELLESKPMIASHVRRVYRHVCVDEFQDTNAAQYRLLVQLVQPPEPDLFVVADDDQLIYAWNGANSARLFELQQLFGMSVLQLPDNFRCPSDVIELANKLIQHNSDRYFDKHPSTAHKTRSSRPAVTVHGAADFADECSWIGAQLKGVALSERSSCVVLARRRKLLEEMAESLTASGIPAHVAIRKNEFESAPFRFLHSMLRLANARQSPEQLRRLAKAFYQLEGVRTDAQDVAARAVLRSEDPLRVWLGDLTDNQEVDADALRVLDVARDSLLERLHVWPFVDAARRWFAVLAVSMEPSGDTSFDEYHDEAQIWDSLVADISRQFVAQELTLHQFLQELDLRAIEVPPPPDSVPCLTIHGAKGTEFRRVFLAGLVEDELPSYAARKKGDDSKEMQEERRSCFVAITRAQDSLALTYAARYQGYTKQPSRFLAEMGLLGHD